MAVPKLYEAHGMSMTMQQWALMLGTSVGKLRGRMYHKGGLENALAVYARVGNERADCIFLEFEGLNLTLKQWCEITGIKFAALDARLQLGWTTEAMLTLPTRDQRLAGIMSNLPAILAYKEAQQ